VLVYKSLHRLALPYLSDDCQLVTDVGRRHLRAADVHTCTVPRTQSRLGDRSFGVAGPRLWNSLPVELLLQDICLTEFRRLLDIFCSLRLGALWPCFNGAGYKHSYILTYLQATLPRPSRSRQPAQVSPQNVISGSLQTTTKIIFILWCFQHYYMNIHDCLL